MQVIIKDWFTAKNGVDWSLTKLLSTVAVVVMIVQFVRTGSTDFQGFGLAVAGLIATLAAKYYVETKQ